MNPFQKIISMHSKRRIIILFLLLFSNSLYSQIINESGSLYSEIGSIISNMPGDTGNDYDAPDLNQLTTWENTLNLLLANNYNAASDSVNTLGYFLKNFTDTTFNPARTYYILERIDTNFWGTYVYYPDYCRSVVIESPHPKKDANTGHQGIHVFKETESFFYCVSGTHRCNSTSLSNCSGTTTGCSPISEPYRTSDMAHNVTTIFQKTTEVLYLNYTNTHFVQLHGFTKLITDPYVILSNGTQETPIPDYLSTFKDNLDIADTSLTFKVAHIDTGWTRLRGFWNAQGRLINSSIDPCTTNATTTNGRFFHVEQEKTKLRDDATGWDKIAYAVNYTFPCSHASTDNLAFEEFINVYPNPTSHTITIQGKHSEIHKNDVKVYNLIGEEVHFKTLQLNQEQSSITLDLSHLPSGWYLINVKNRVKKVYKI